MKKNKKKKKVVKSNKQTKQLPLSNKGRTYFLGFLMVLSFGLYVNTLGHQYAFDDSIVITENEFTKQGFSGIKDLMTKDFFEGIYGESTELTGGRYRPLSLAMFAIEYQFFGKQPFFSHLMNVLFYCICLYLLFLVLELCFGRSSLIPYLTTLIFAVHPLHTEVVANIKSRDELLCFFFLLLAIVALFKAVDTKQYSKWLIIGSVLYFLGLLAKETAITYLPVFPLLIYYFRKDALSGDVVKGLIFLAPAILYLAIRVSLVGMPGGADSTDIMENPFVNSSFSEKYATIFLILLKYFFLQILPHPLTSDYSFNQIPFVGWGNIFVIISLIFHFGMGIFMVLKLKSKNIFALCILLYLAPLSITSNIVFNIGAPMGERFLFIPTLGFCLALAYGMTLFFKEKEFTPNLKQNYGLLGLVGVIVLASCLKTVVRNKDWYDNETLFQQDVITSANSAKMQYYYGNTLLKNYLADPKTTPKSVLDAAEKHFKLGAEINPKFHHCLYNLGSIYDQKDNAQEAIKYLNKTLELHPNHINSHSLLGKVYGRLVRDFDKSIFYLERAVNEFKQDSPGVLQNLGNAYAEKQLYTKAIPIYEKLIAKDPGNARYYLNLGITYQRMGNQAKAKSNFDKAVAIDPSLKK